MKDIDDLPEDVALIAKRALGTRNANVELLGLLEGMGATFEDCPGSNGAPDRIPG